MQDTFHEVISLTVQLLVRGLESECVPAVAQMAKMKYEDIVEVGDTSM